MRTGAGSIWNLFKDIRFTCSFVVTLRYLKNMFYCILILHKNYNIIITIIVTTLQISRFNIFVQNPIKAHIKDEVLQAI